MKLNSKKINLDNGIDYAKWLSAEQKRLGFTKKDLAAAIDKDVKTVERYLNGENKKTPTDEVHNRILNYIASLEKHGNYKWRTPEQFGSLLINIMSELQVTQQQFADMIGKDQRTVSKYTYGDINTSVTEQFDILYCVYKKELEKNRNNENCTAYDLRHMLFGIDEKEAEILKELSECPYYEEDDDIGNQEDLLDFFDTLGSDLQAQILRHYRAFFEQTEEQVECDVTVMLSSYHDRERLMNAFMYMSEEERSTIIYEYEQNSIMTYPRPDDTEEVIYFSAVADMRSLVFDEEYYDALESMKKKTKPNKSNKNRFLLEQLIHRHGIMRGSLDELKMKLNFSGYDWYVWSLLLIRFHNSDDEDKL